VSLRDQSLASVLAATAAPTPAPGGGSSSAAACALAAALVEMAAGIGSEVATAQEEARTLRLRALDLAEAELGSYAPVLEARRRGADDDAVAAALLEASRTPLAIAEAAARVAELGAGVAAAANPSVRGDAVVGVVLAEAAASAAAGLVTANLGGAGALVERARAARAAAGRARRAAEEGAG
jgi:formiminotetrahydrofolate cyclodeaminase